MNYTLLGLALHLIYCYIHLRHNSEQWYPTGGLDEVSGCALTFYCSHMCTTSIGRRPEVDTGSRSSAWLRDCDSKTRTRLSCRKRCLHCKGRSLLVVRRSGSSALDESACCCPRHSRIYRVARQNTRFRPPSQSRGRLPPPPGRTSGVQQHLNRS
jgi:hypothetical protein